ncbi:MAG: CBS domain-containing protein [Kofleriaceae bacterium]|nr:CBS domain-containing protein [Kofleriaceae bacterium]MCL4227544.1 CBS domain-containing protein [Myxococcales bacterium]
MNDDLKVRELMQKDVIVVNPETSLLDVHRLFVEEEINGAPVVEENTGKVVGVISSLDLLRVVREEFDQIASVPGAYFRDELPGSDPDWNAAPADLAERMGERTVGDAMVTERVSVTSETTIAEAAALMRKQRIHRVLVVDDHELVGILTTFDLLQVLAAPDRAPKHRGPPRRAAGDPTC